MNNTIKPTRRQKVHSDECLAFSQRLRMARETAQMTQEQAAFRAQMHWTAWAHMEQGTRTPNIRNLAKACRAVRCSADWLLGLSTERPKARIVIVDGETFIPQNAIGEARADNAAPLLPATL